MAELVELLAGEIEERGREKSKHENAEKTAGRERPHEFGSEGEEISTPGKTESGRQPMRHAVGDFRVLEKIDDDAEQPEDASSGDQATGIERSGTGFAFVFLLGGGFDEYADQTSSEHGSRGAERKIRAGGKCQGAYAKNFHGDYQRHTHQYQMPGQALVENAADDGSHQASLRSGGLVAANALRPLEFDLFCTRVVEILAIRDFMRAKGIDERIGFALVEKSVAFDLYTRGESLNVDGNLRGQIFLQALVHQIESSTDGEGGNCYTDQKPHLLPERRGADEVAGLKVLRSGARNGGGDTHNPTNHQREHLIVRRSPSGHEEDRTSGHQGGDT